MLFQPPPAYATLRTENVAVALGRPFLAAVEIVCRPHWHVYWRNPGDSGIPTQIQWSAPRGWKVEPLEYPAPHRFAPGGIAAYGYEGATLFLVRVTPTRQGGILAAKAKWLVCSNACIAGGATLSTKIHVSPHPKLRPTARRLRMALTLLPRPAQDGSFRAVQSGGKVSLTASLRTNSADKAEFFPLESGVVDQSKPFVATLKGGRFVFQMDASPFPEKRDRLKGLLVFPGPPRQALIIEPKLEIGEKK